MAKLNTSGFDEVVKGAVSMPSEHDANPFPHSGINTSMMPNVSNIAPVTDREKKSQLESLLRGAGQGATLGFGDELQGALQSLGDVASSDKTLSDIPDLYTKRRDAARQQNKEAEQDNPMTYFGGNIAGGLVLPGGIIGKGAGVATGLTKAAILAAEGAAGGGLAGLGSSESDTLKGNLNDAKGGAELGAVMGPALGQVLPNIVKGTGKFAESFGPVREAKDVFMNRMAGGQSLRGTEALNREAKNMKGLVTDQLMPLVGKGANEIKNEAYSNAYATQSGEDPSIIPIIEKAKQKIIDMNLDPEEAQKALAVIERYARKGEATTGFKQVKGAYTNPEEARTADFISSLKGKQDKKAADYLSKLPEGTELPEGLDTSDISMGAGESFGTPMAKVSNPVTGDINVNVPKNQGRGEFSKIEPVTSEVYNKPQQSLDQLTELKTQLEDFASRPDSIGKYAQGLKKDVDNLINSQIDPNSYEFANKLQNLVSEAESKFGMADWKNNQGPTSYDRTWRENQAKKLSDMFKKIGGQRAPEEAQRVTEGFNALKQLDPTKATNVQDALEEQGRKYYLSSAMNKEGTPVFGKSPLSVLSSAKGIGLGAADVTGGMARSLLDSPPAELGKAAAALAAKGQTKYAQILQQASLAPNDKRKALIFTLSQNPDFRKAMSSDDDTK